MKFLVCSNQRGLAFGKEGSIQQASVEFDSLALKSWDTILGP